MKAASRTMNTLRFTAELSAGGSRAAEIAVPKKVSTAIPKTKEVALEGTMEGFPFRALFETNNGGPRISISSKLQAAIGSNVGDKVSVEITRIGDEAEVRIPADLLDALEASPKAAALFAEITPLARREWVRWICSAKQEETRVRRIEVGMDKLSKGMRRPCCFPGLNFVTKDLVPPEDTWFPLPGAKP